LDGELRLRVARLLAAQPNVEAFLEQPFAGRLDSRDGAAVCEGPGTMIGLYKLLEQIGEGGMGLVFMAEQLQPVRRRVALKILKPSNVLVSLHDTVPVPKIIDFGIAKATGEQLTDRTLFTHFAQIIGTPLYMSPEQAEMNGLGVDTRSDVYALGVMLYELLTGATPFDSVTLKNAGYDEMRRIIREDEPPRPSQRVRTLEAADCNTISAPRA